MSKPYIPLVSIIVIDYKKSNPYLIECLDAIQKQTYRNFEVILESDHPLAIKYPNLKIIDYGGRYKSPAFKRDHGGQVAKGEILAFIDDDAYPHPKWLENIISHFKDEQIAGVGGPGITPPGVTWQEEASGWVSVSLIGAGFYTYRFVPGKKQHVDDYPSMNLAIRKTDFREVGGFDSNYWPGEDTKLCLDLTKKLGKKIIYEPKAKVFHHRRPLWLPHLRQNGNFGLHRGFFARILPETSLRPIYFMPTLMLLGLIFLLISFPFSFPIVQVIRQIGIIMFLIYFLVLLINSFWIYTKSKKVTQGIISIPAIFITHLWYGVRFIQGFLFTGKLKR